MEIYIRNKKIKADSYYDGHCVITIMKIYEPRDGVFGLFSKWKKVDTVEGYGMWNKSEHMLDEYIFKTFGCGYKTLLQVEERKRKIAKIIE